MTSLYSHGIFFGFILVDYQTELCEKYLITGDWTQSKCFLLEQVPFWKGISMQKSNQEVIKVVFRVKL